MLDSTQRQLFQMRARRLRRVLYVLVSLSCAGFITQIVSRLASFDLGRWVILTLYGTMACVIGILGCLLAHRDYARRLRRADLRPCRKCGYDLTGNTSGTCPECGTKIETP